MGFPVHDTLWGGPSASSQGPEKTRIGRQGGGSSLGPPGEALGGMLVLFYWLCFLWSSTFLGLAERSPMIE